MFGHHHGRHGSRHCEERGERRERFGHRRGGGFGRLFAHGDLHLVVLYMIAEQPRHGYDLIKAISERVGGAYSPSPGTIYPALAMLWEQGYAEVSPGEGGRKVYAATADGRAYLDENRDAVEALLERMGEAGRCAAEPPAILRARENLRFALDLRLRGGGLSDDAARAIAAILDRAAAEIEGAR